jgi:penicillin-binding protein 2
MKRIFLLPILLLSLVCPGLFAVQPVHTKKKLHAKSAAKGRVAVRKPATHSATTRAALAGVAAGAVLTKANYTRGSRVPARKRWVQTWDEPTYKDSTTADNPDGEDLVVRKAAADALGGFNGSIVVVDPTNGRILTIVNQKLALGTGFQPCSTIKVSVALAALREKIVERTSPIHLYGRTHMDLTNAIAHSNNYYFANLGVKLGYERVNYYAHLFGYGEKAGLNIPGEQAGYFPPAPPKNGGMGMLTSFGEEIQQTPLELAGLMTAIANGGTLYYLQYPRTPEEIKDFQPQVKRHLDIASLIPEIKPGMQGAVEFGTARRAKQDDTLYGKTGTCSEGRTRLGWFGSFSDAGKRKVVVVVLLTGGRPTIGPLAAGVAGDVYRNLAAQKYFQSAETPLIPATLISNQLCCGGR